MWTRDHYFPQTYAHATWGRLLPFFQLPGLVAVDQSAVSVSFRPFNDRHLNEDLTILCQRVNKAPPHLPDGRQLLFTVGTGSQAFIRIDASSVRRSDSRQLPINSEAAPVLPLTVFFLAVSQALSKSNCADCKKASLPVGNMRHPILDQHKRRVA